MESSTENLALDKIPPDKLFQAFNQRMFTKDFTTKDVGVTPRVIMHWKQLGLLFESERQFDENHKFHFVELIWLKIVCELRAFGMPLSTILKVKDYLVVKKPIHKFLNLETTESIKDFYSKLFLSITMNSAKAVKIMESEGIIEKLKQFEFGQLEMGLFNYISEREDSKIYISPYGHAVIDFNNQDQKNPEVSKILREESCIVIPFFKLIRNFLKNPENYKFSSDLSILTATEAHILFLINEGKFESIRIDFKNGKPFILEGEKRINVDLKARVGEIFLNREYSTLLVKNQTGDEIAYSSIKTKFKL
jgi:DNA-binding transcriptional MerR regulator